MNSNPLKELGTALGVGILAGAAGTAAITLSQMIEMSITDRDASDTPTKAVSKVLHVKPVRKEKKPTVTQEIHWTYGTSWGVGRGLLSYAGLHGLPASLAHFGAVWGAELIMMPSLDLAPPVTEQKPKNVAIDAMHHAVYALVAGLVFDAIMNWDK
jgi:hypothetical protein